MTWFLGLFVTPAFVSLVVSLWAGRFLEERRARRDHVTRLFESAREEVRRAVEAAIEYFSIPPGARTALQEARVIANDREIRAALPFLLDNARAVTDAEVTVAARDAFSKFVEQLTGGTFQSSEGEISPQHIIAIVYAGARLRTALARLRDAELKDRANQDPVFRWVRETWKTCRQALYIEDRRRK